jgi:hypothetical protein
MTKPSRHGLRALRTKVQIRGTTGIDYRSAGAKELRAWRDEIVAALGGPAAVSPQRKTLIELACRSRAWLDECDAYLFSLKSIIVRRRKCLVPLVMQRMAIAAELARLLDKLGLDFAARPVTTINSSVFEAAREELKRLSKPKGENDGNEPERPDGEAVD